MKHSSRVQKVALIFALELVLFAPFFWKQPFDIKSKNVDQYWQNTGLTSKELKTMLSDENCFQTERKFLACANAISNVAERYNLVFTTEGRLRNLEASDIAHQLTEKTSLIPWQEKYIEISVSRSVSFLAAWNVLEQTAIKPSELSVTVATGINGYLSVDRDPHTYLMPIALYEEVISNAEGKQYNLGLISRRVQDALIVKKVFEGSPAFKAGLKKGDRIIEINGQKVALQLPSKISELLGLRKADRISLLIERKNETKIVDIVKQQTQFQSVVSRILESGNSRVGLITIHKFAKDSCKLVKRNLISMLEQNAGGIMMDLRDNPGGQVEEAACVINLFVEKGQALFETRYLDPTIPSDKYVSEKDPIYKGSVVILINSGSASAAEIVAGSMKDLGRATLVGERTYGKGSFQDGRVWGANSKIAMFETEGLYYFPSGWTPQLVGLEPDIAVSFNTVDQQREGDLYLNPISPLDPWNGPQSISWLQERKCDLEMMALMNSTGADDPQMSKAQAWLSCGEANGRNGSL